MKKSGYTLIELLIAIAVFTVVIAAPAGFFVTAIKGQQKTLASQEMYDNISYVLEYMSRALRMAKKDFEGDCCSVPNTNYELTGGGSGIIFKNYQGECQEFYWNGTQLFEVKNKLEAVQLTSSNIAVKDFMIEQSGWSQTDTIQPKVKLFLSIEEGIKGELDELHPKMKIQTSVSQRKLDIEY